MHFCKFLMFSFIVILLCCSAAGFSQASELNILSQINEFKATPDAVGADQRPRLVDQMSGVSVSQGISDITNAYYAVKKGERFIFRVVGNSPDNRTMRWESPLNSQNAEKTPYYLIRYKAHGQRRDYNTLSVISISGENGKGEKVSISLLDCSEVINDNNWHVVIGKKEMSVNIKSFDVQLSTLGTDAVLEIDTCSFSESFPDATGYIVNKSSKKIAKNTLEFVDISNMFNDDYAALVARSIKRFEKVIDAGNVFSNPVVNIDGVAFTVKTSGKNIVAPPSDPNANAGTVNVLGTELSKTNYKKVAREDNIEVKIGKKASEVYFVLISEMANSIGRYALPKIPLQISSVDCFAVELVYADGQKDFAFPYSIADGGYVIQRVLGAYAVSADNSRTLKSIIFHNRFYGASFCLAAVALNTGKQIVIPKSITKPEPYVVKNMSRPAETKAKITQNGKIYKIENSDYMMKIDCSKGFAITELVHKWSPKSKVLIGKDSGIEINIGDKSLSGLDFNVEKASVNSNSLNFALKCKDADIPLNVSLSISGDISSQIKFNAEVTNTGNKAINANLRFPILKGLTIDGLADTWMYFPQCRNIISKDFGTYIAPNDRPFVMQFFDVFNPKSGIGLSFITHNLNQAVLDYSVRKNQSGVEAYVQYPGDFNVINAGTSRKLTQTNLVFHGGDWHQSLAAYENWKNTWYKPIKIDKLDWWYKSFNLRSHVTARSYSWAVPIYDPVKNTYIIDDIVKEDIGYTGAKPDVYHLGGWINYKNLFAGDFLGGDYAIEDITGGLDVFKIAVNKMQSENIKVSVYTIPDRCAKSSKIGQEMGAKIAQVNADGSLSQDDNHWYLCLKAKEWQDHYVQALKKIQQETGVNAVYVDVFGFTHGYSCYSKEHGHEVPMNVNDACNQLITRLRKELPDGVAIWSEFLLTDVNSQFTSGNITYYFLTLHEYMVKSYDKLDKAPLFTPPAQSVHRFAFPNIKQFGFPVGYENGVTSYDLQALFFNGEGLNDVGWLLYDSRDLAKVSKWLAIQKKYDNCFASKNPVPFVLTDAGEVYANMFPAKNQTAWTFFNARFATFRGNVITVDHKNGDTYFDAWNKKPIKPTIIGSKAALSISLDPQGLGCIVKSSK